MPRNKTMNKILLSMWLLAPIAVVVGLWQTVDREAPLKSRARVAALLAGASVTGGATAAEPKMVRPESLDQGFVVVVKDLSGLATKESPIYIASSHNGWDPSDKRSIFSARSDLRWQLVFEKPKIESPISFKLTRGNWDTVEVDDALGDIQNRQMPMVDAAKLAPGEKPVIELVVPKWADQKPSSSLRPDLNPYFTIADKPYIKRLQVAGGGVQAMRDVLVCLPPGYDDAANASRTYPVLYMQDGQNLFLDMPGTKGSWNADTTMMSLVGTGEIEPIIIVGIPHLGRARAAEYLPVSLAEGDSNRGDRYADWVVSEVMPRIERAFRVKTGPENTAIGGSSYGAVAALNAASRHPTIFGKVLLESMPLTGSAAPLMAHFKAAKTFPPVIYFGIGGSELGPDGASADRNNAYAATAETFKEMALGKVRTGAAANVQTTVDAAGVHDEPTWAKRFPAALRMLFGKPAAK